MVVCVVGLCGCLWLVCMVVWLVCVVVCGWSVWLCGWSVWLLVCVVVCGWSVWLSVVGLCGWSVWLWLVCVIVVGLCGWSVWLSVVGLCGCVVVCVVGLHGCLYDHAGQCTPGKYGWCVGLVCSLHCLFLLQEDHSRVEIFKEYAKKRKESVWQPFFLLLERSDMFIVHQVSPGFFCLLLVMIMKIVNLFSVLI